MDINIGHPAMTDSEIFEAGKNGCARGWKNIPPYSIASISRDKPSAVEIWQDGWRNAQGVQLMDKHEG